MTTTTIFCVFQQEALTPQQWKACVDKDKDNDNEDSNENADMNNGRKIARKLMKSLPCTRASSCGLDDCLVASLVQLRRPIHDWLTLEGKRRDDGNPQC